MREFALEFLNYVYPIISSDYILFTGDTWTLYMFAGFWAFFSRLPSSVVFLSVLLCAVAGLRRLFFLAAGRQTTPRCPVWFLGLILVLDAGMVLALAAVVGFLGLLRGLTISTYLATYYAPTDSSDPIWLRTVLGGMGELGFQFRVDLVAAVFVLVVLVVLSVCLFCYELRQTTAGVVYTILLKAAACCAFCASNLLTFIVFTEISSILVLFIISQSSSSKRLHAGFLYFIYSAMSGVLLLAATAVLVRCGKSTTFELLGEDAGRSTVVISVCIGLIICALLVKIPTGPFYHWLLKAHVEASTAGSIILAAVMLKIPACALLRVTISFGYRLNTPYVVILLVCSVFAMVVCAAQMWHESDLKRIVALSSVVHMGGSVLIIAVSGLLDAQVSISTILALLLAHSFSSALMFAVVGMLSARYHTRDFTAISGIFSNTPKLSCVF